ncbi:hypothetical protein LCGC14_2529510 [marine sediment metagenome]|uniref:Uncharacterized protein n=1 Tax=marine sediment metagenome TaxID=412755 RepID=A0A0F9BGX6_9ZZZZ
MTQATIKKTFTAEYLPWNCRGMGAGYAPARYGVFVDGTAIGYIWKDNDAWLVARLNHKTAAHFPQYAGGLKAAKVWAIDNAADLSLNQEGS